MNVIIDAIITILQILAFGNAVRANQDINVFILICGIEDIPVF